MATLGSCTGTDDGDGVVGGSGVGGDANLGRASTLCNASAIFKSVFFVASPASKVPVVEERGVVSIDIISNAACLRKSSVFTSGKGTTFGKKVTVSTSLCDLVLGK
jgi:hypothetical protein